MLAWAANRAPRRRGSVSGCTRIGASAATRTAGLLAPAQRVLAPARPNTAQRETPGLF